MQLNIGAMKEVLNYLIEKQQFDLNDGKMEGIYLTTIVNELSGEDENQKQEIACAISRCIKEGLVYSDYPRTVWATAIISDISMRGFEWLKNN